MENNRTLPHHLFVYGLLRSAFRNEMAALLVEKGVLMGEGYVYGELYDLGVYPALILGGIRQGRVMGDIYQLEDEGILSILDDFEGIGDRFTRPFEYQRKLAKTFINNEVLDCWLYEYQWKVGNKHLIESGNYLSYRLGILG